MNHEAATIAFNDILEDTLQHEREFGGELQALRQGVGFFVANHIATAKSADLLQQCPPWVVEKVLEYVKVLDEQGEVLVYSNLGAADHTTMVRELKRILHNHS